MVKQDTQTKEKIIKKTINLFLKKGYDKTTIQDIIDEVGVSKGAFYHYFKSKEDILETISDEYVKKSIKIIDEVLNDENLSAIQKLNKAIKTTQLHKKSNKERVVVRSSFEKENNLKLEKKIFNKIKKEIIPRYIKIIKQGVQENTFNVTQIEECAEFLFYTTISMKNSIEEILKSNNENNKKLIENRLEFYEEVFTKILGINVTKLKLVKNIVKVDVGKIELKKPYLERIFGDETK